MKRTSTRFMPFATALLIAGAGAVLGLTVPRSAHAESAYAEDFPNGYRCGNQGCYIGAKKFCSTTCSGDGCTCTAWDPGDEI